MPTKLTSQVSCEQVLTWIKDRSSLLKDDRFDQHYHRLEVGMPKKRIQVTGVALVSQIEERAYAIWENEGKPHGRDVEHWLRAKAETEAGLATNANRLIKPRERSSAHVKNQTKIKRRKK